MRRPPVVLLRRLALLHPLQLLLALQVFHTFCHPRRRRRALQVIPEPLHDPPVVARVGWVEATAETHHNPDVMMGSTPFHPHSPMSLRSTRWQVSPTSPPHLFLHCLESADEPAAHAYAQLAAERRQAGRPMAQFDAQIVAIARSRGAALATRNVMDFEGCGVQVFNPWQEG
jgi:hypothetical protein